MTTGCTTLVTPERTTKGKGRVKGSGVVIEIPPFRRPVSVPSATPLEMVRSRDNIPYPDTNGRDSSVVGLGFSDPSRVLFMFVPKEKKKEKKKKILTRVIRFLTSGSYSRSTLPPGLFRLISDQFLPQEQVRLSVYKKRKSKTPVSSLSGEYSGNPFYFKIRKYQKKSMRRGTTYVTSDEPLYPPVRIYKGLYPSVTTSHYPDLKISVLHLISK